MGNDGPLPNIQLEARKKGQFDVDAEKETLFDTKDTLNINIGKFPIYKMHLLFI